MPPPPSFNMVVMVYITVLPHRVVETHINLISKEGEKNSIPLSSPKLPRCIPDCMLYTSTVPEERPITAKFPQEVISTAFRQKKKRDDFY